MVELGNFQVKSKTQQKPEIKYDTFTDLNTLSTLKRSNTTKILEVFNLKNFNWSQSYIRSRFQLAEDYASQVDYLVFLLQEEIYLPSQTSGWQHVSSSSANGDSYTIYGVTIPKMPDSGEKAYFLALLKAWKMMCNSLNKKTAYIGCASSYEPKPSIGWTNLYSSEGLNYISQNYDMIYIYRFPTSINEANCTNKGYCSKEYIDYWRNTLKYKGKINYILDTYFNDKVGSLDYNIIKADFINAANNGADIISAYPFKNITTNDTLATSRLIQISNEYQPNQCKQISCTFTIN